MPAKAAQRASDGGGRVSDEMRKADGKAEVDADGEKPAGNASGAADSGADGGRPPRRTRLMVTGSIAASLLLWLPVWWYATRVYRAPLPFADISSFTADVSARPISLPVHVDVILLLRPLPPSHSQQQQQQQEQQQQQQESPPPSRDAPIPASQLRATAKAALSALCSPHTPPSSPHDSTVDSPSDAVPCGSNQAMSVTLWAVRGTACQSAVATSAAASEPPSASESQGWPCHLDWALVADASAQLSESAFDTWLDGQIQSTFSRSNLSRTSSPSSSSSSPQPPWNPVLRTQQHGGRYSLLLLEAGGKRKGGEREEAEAKGGIGAGGGGVMCESEWGTEVVVGKHRHAWMVLPVPSATSASLSASPSAISTDLFLLLAPMATQSLAALLLPHALHTATSSGSSRVAELPIGPDSAVSVSWSLLNADPHQWAFQWDFPSLHLSLLRPLQTALSPLLNLHFHSQVLYFAPMAAAARWNERAGVHEVQASDLPFMVNADSWHLHASLPLMAHGRSKLLHVVVYVPSLATCPLTIASHTPTPTGGSSNERAAEVPPWGFISPGWGSVIVFNPPNCSLPSSSPSPSPSPSPSHSSPHLLTSSSFTPVLALAIAQLRSLFGLSATPPAFCRHSPATAHTHSTSSSSGSGRSWSRGGGGLGARSLSAWLRGVTEWEVDSLLRQRLPADEKTIAASLASVSALVQSLPSMVVRDDISEYLYSALASARAAREAAKEGRYEEAQGAVREARRAADAVLFHPSMEAGVFYPLEHHLAIYSPLFFPVGLHAAVAFIRELRRFLQQRRLAKLTVW